MQLVLLQPVTLSLELLWRQVRESSPKSVLTTMFFLSPAPSAGPASLSAGTVTVNSITVQWEEVPCLHRNGEITGYTVVARTSGEVVQPVDVNVDDGREATVSGLNPNTQYSVSVAAVNSAGIGLASEIDIMTCKYCDWETAQYTYY